MKAWLNRDEILSQRLRIQQPSGWLLRLTAIMAHSGDSWFWVLGLAGLWLIGAPEWRPVITGWLVSILGGAVIVLVLKFLIRRRRPDGEWGGIYRRTDPHSFPSGHAARAFLIAGLGLLSLPWPLALALAIWAPLVSLARVSMGVHYLSDVVAGALLGLLLALAAALLLPMV